MDSDESSSVGGGSAPRTVAQRSDAPAKADGGKSAKPTSGKGAPAKGKPAEAKGKAAPAKPAAGGKAGEPIIPKKGDGEYGVTKRRGEGTYQLRDVPYIQYFAAGQALHTAYWHDVFGKKRSHGCVNLSPIDAHRVFQWTEPAMPAEWHGLNTGDENGVGTTIIIHE